MSYVRIRNWDRYQNADVFKKSKGRPPWCKLFTRRDLEFDAASIEARLLFYELLRVATEYANVMSNDLNWISRETRLPLKVVAKGLPELLKGAWLTETTSPRRSRKIREKFSTRQEVEKKPPSPPSGKQQKLALVNACPECFCGGGVHTEDCTLRREAS